MGKRVGKEKKDKRRVLTGLRKRSSSVGVVSSRGAEAGWLLSLLLLTAIFIYCRRLFVVENGYVHAMECCSLLSTSGATVILIHSVV